MSRRHEHRQEEDESANCSSFVESVERRNRIQVILALNQKGKRGEEGERGYLLKTLELEMEVNGRENCDESEAKDS